MSIYLIEISLVFLLWQLRKYNVKSIKKTTDGEVFYLCCCFFMFGMTMALRKYTVGTDTATYYGMYQNIGAVIVSNTGSKGIKNSKRNRICWDALLHYEGYLFSAAWHICEFSCNCGGILSVYKKKIEGLLFVVCFIYRLDLVL